MSGAVLVLTALGALVDFLAVKIAFNTMGGVGLVFIIRYLLAAPGHPFRQAGNSAPWMILGGLLGLAFSAVVPIGGERFYVGALSAAVLVLGLVGAHASIGKTNWSGLLRFPGGKF